MNKLRNTEPYRLYIILISVIGCGLAAAGLWFAPSYVPRLHFVLLIILSLLAAFNTTSVAISEKAGVTYAVGEAIALASVPFYGVLGAGLIVALHNVFLWLIKPADRTTWKKSLNQVAFNVGMQVIAMCVAAISLLVLRDLFGSMTLLGRTVPWLVAGFTDNVVNLALLAGVIRLQHGAQFNLGEFFKSNRWAIQILTLIFGVGGGLVALAIENYGWVGITIFYLPIFLSAYAFRLYVRQMQAHMDNLEKIVAERTEELRTKTLSLEEKTAELSALNEQKDAYLAVLTHDMMTPLSNIQLCTEILTEDESLNDENLKLAHLILRSEKMLFGMVRNILDIEKLRAGEALRLQLNRCDMNQLVTQVVLLVQAEAIDRQVGLAYLPTETPAWIVCDRTQIERVLLNLIGNAIKYTPVDGQVTVHLIPSGTALVVEVEDTGFGIPENELPYVFERFRRVEQLADSITGTGLGLAITKALVEGHGGTISAESKEGVGSRFTVILPTKLDPAEQSNSHGQYHRYQEAQL